MKHKNLLFTLTTLFSISVLLSCATAIPSPEKGKGTLVVIPLQHDIEYNFELHLDYYVQINDLHTDKVVRSVKVPDNRNYILIRSLDPGDYYVAGYKWRSDNKSGDLVRIHRDLSPFRVEQGLVSLTPYGFSWHKSRSDDGKNINRFNMLKNDDGILHNEILRQLYAENPEDMALWGIPEVTDSTITEQIKTVLSDAPELPFELDFIDLLSGQSLSMENLRGKVVVIDFWATWCPPCVAEIPKMIELYETYQSKGVEFIGISLDGKGASVVDFCEEWGINWPQYSEEGKTWDTEFSQKWGINAIPQVFILDQKGKIYSKEARGKLNILIPELLGIEDDRVFGFYNFNGTGLNEVQEPYAAGDLQMRAKLPDDKAESTYAALSNYIDFENNSGRSITDNVLLYKSSTDNNFPPYDYVRNPHVSVPDLKSREFTMGLGFSISGNTSRLSKQTIFLNMTADKANEYFTLRYKEIDEWWNELSKEERSELWSLYKEKEQNLFERIEIKTAERYRMTLFQSGFVGRWFNLYIESNDKENWELVMVLNNIDWRIPLGIDIAKDTDYNLWVNFDFPSMRVDFWLNDSHYPIDISHVPNQSFCPSGGTDNFAMQLMPGILSPNSEVDYFFIANGNRSFSEIKALYSQYYEK